MARAMSDEEDARLLACTAVAAPWSTERPGTTWSRLAVLSTVLGAAAAAGLCMALAHGRGHPTASSEHASKVTQLSSMTDEEVDQEQKIVDIFSTDTNFLWGAATSSYQVEGAVNESGRTPSIWDVFAHTEGKTWRGENADVTTDFYHRYEGDLQLLQSYGFNTFRFSISWSRVMPTGEDGVRRPNPAGIRFYKDVLSSLAVKRITPVVTMYHWDLPVGLDWSQYGIIEVFLEYADFLWQTFPEIDIWATFNEPASFCILGYNAGLHAPGIRSDRDHITCVHHVLLAHAKAVDLFRRKYQTDRSQIGIILNYDFPQPLDPDNEHDVQATEYHRQANLGWFADPIYLGDYPEIVKMRMGEKLPVFTEAEKQLLKGSYIGYYGMNTYSGKYVFARNGNPQDFRATYYRHGKSIGETFIRSWLFKAPKSIRSGLEWVNERYKPTSIIITENGCNDPGDTEFKDTTHDWDQVAFFRDYLSEVAKAKQEGVPVQGYIAWALLDNFEWAEGFKRRFGITYVNFHTQERTPKVSAKWFERILGQIRLSQAWWSTG